MKKYVVLLVAASLAVAGIFGIRSASKPAMIETVTLAAGDVERTVICTGRVEISGKSAGKSGGAVAASASPAAVQVRLSVGEHTIRQIREGQRVYLSGSAFQKERYEGTVISIADAATRPAGSAEAVVEAVVALDAGEADESVRAGLSAKATVVVDVAENTVLVPYTCVMQDEAGQEYLYLVREGKAKKTVLDPLAELSDGLLVRASALDGETVVASPDKGVYDGARVLIGGGER